MRRLHSNFIYFSIMVSPLQGKSKKQTVVETSFPQGEVIETLLLAVQIYEVYMYAETFSQPKDKTKFWWSPSLAAVPPC